MAGIGAITLDAAGAVTAPTTVPFDLPSADSTRANGHALCSFVTTQFGKDDGAMAAQGVMWANGVDPVRHYITSVLGTGLLAPVSALTAASTATKATQVLTFGANANNGDRITVNGRYVYFVTTLGGVYVAAGWDEVLIGASAAATIDNLYALVNGNSGYGSTYYNGLQYNGISPSSWAEATTVEASAESNTTCTFRATYAGTGPNSWAVAESTATVRMSWGAATFSGGAAGTGTAPSAGTYQYAYAYFREDDGALSGLSPTAELVSGGDFNNSISGMTASGDTTVDNNRVYRTTTGGGRFYRVNEVSAATTTLTDSYADSTITAFGSVPYDERLYRTFVAGVAPKVRYLAMYRGRVFGAGALVSAPYTQGTVTVNTGTRTATFTSGYVRRNMIGRRFRMTATAESFRIVDVSESANTATLDKTRDGTLANQAYEIVDDRDPYEVFWSEPGLPNNWPVTNSIKGVSSKDGKGVTGIYAAFESLIIFTRQAVWRLTGYDNTSFQLQLVSDKCGCVSGHTVVMDGERMYWLGQDGVYGWAGSGEPVNLSSPPVEAGVVRGIGGTMERLTLGYAHRAVAVYDEYEGEVRFHVPLDGENTNRYSIVLDLQAQAFNLDCVEDFTWEGIFQGPDGEDFSIAGDIAGGLWQTWISNSDGAFGFEPVQSVSAATVRTATVSGTPFPTSSGGLAGCPVWQVSADGTFARSTVASNTSAVLTYRRYQTAQSTSTQMVVGGICMRMDTGRSDIGSRRINKTVAGVTVAHSPDSDGQYFFASSYNQGDLAIPTRGWAAGDLTATGGRRRFIVSKDAMLHGFSLLCVEPGCDPAFSGLTLEVMAGVDDLDL